MANKHFQILRGKIIYDNMAAAKEALVLNVSGLLPGEPSMAYYHTNKGKEGDKVLALFGLGGGASGSTVFYDSKSVDDAITSAQTAASTVVSAGTGTTVTKSGGTAGTAATYTVAANLKMQYNAAVSGTSQATITLKSGDEVTTYGTVNVSDIIGNGILKSSSYDKTTGILTLNFSNASGGTDTQTVNLKEMLDIDDVVIGDNSKNYLTTSLSGATGTEQTFVLDTKMQAVSANTAGLADAKDVKTYVDKAVADKNVTATGDTVYIAATASDNKVTVTGTYGTFSGSAKSTDGIAKVADVAGAISAAVNALDATVSADTTNVNVTVTETNGKLTNVAVSEDYATITRTASTSTEASPQTNAALAVTTGDESKLVKASDLNNVALYAADKAKEEADARKKAIADLDFSSVGGNGSVISTVSQTDGKISATTISLSAGNVSATAISSGDTTVAVTGTTVENQIASLGKSVKTEEKARIAQDNTIESSVGLAADGSHQTTTGNYTSAATTVVGEIAALDSQVKTNADNIKALQDAKVSVSASTDTESARYLEVSVNDAKTVYTVKAKGIESAITSAINALDKTDTAVANQFVTAVSETNGVISVSRGTVAASGVTATEIAATTSTVAVSGTTVADQIASLGKAIKTEENARTSATATVTDTNTVASDGDNLTVSVTTTGGNVSAVSASITSFDCGEW